MTGLDLCLVALDDRDVDLEQEVLHVTGGSLRASWSSEAPPGLAAGCSPCAPKLATVHRSLEEIPTSLVGAGPAGLCPKGNQLPPSRARRQVISRALAAGLSVRGYVSTVFVCPYEGEVPREKAPEITQRLLDLGVDEVSLGDTIGAGSPRDVHRTVGHILATVPADRLALHFHDTYGTALANVYAGLELGITTYDASAGGLGGCPYAPGASDNLATEVYLLDRMGIDSGVFLEKVARASLQIARVLGRNAASGPALGDDHVGLTAVPLLCPTGT